MVRTTETFGKEMAVQENNIAVPEIPFALSLSKGGTASKTLRHGK